MNLFFIQQYVGLVAMTSQSLTEIQNTVTRHRLLSEKYVNECCTCGSI